MEVTQEPARQGGRTLLARRPFAAAKGVSLHISKIGFGVALAAALLAPSVAFAADISFCDEGKAQAGLEKIYDKAGYPTKVLGLDIRSNQLIAEVQDPNNPQHIDSWTDWLGTGTLERLLSPEHVAGPRPVELTLINRDLDANLFELKPADLALVAKLAAAAVKQAGLEDPARVDRMELRRQLHLVPEPSSGPPEWSIEVTSGRERATVYANLAGEITHANLDGTLHAQRLNYLLGGKDLDDAVGSIADTLGKAPIIKRLLVYDRSLTFEALNPDHPNRDSRFNAGLNGVYRDLDDTLANAGIRPDTPPARFGIADVDWTLLPKLEQAARDRLELPGGTIPYVEISRPSSGVGEPAIQWEVNVRSATDFSVEGSVVFDPKGNLLRTRYPSGKGPKLDLFEAADYASAFAALSHSLGEHAAIVELRFDSDRLLATVRDPKNPSAQTVLEYHGEALTRSILPPLDWPTFGPDWFFDLSQAQPVGARWGELQHDALGRLGLADGKIDRITISKQKLFMQRNDRVLIEVRAVSGKRDGRVVYDLNGKVVDIDKP